MKKAYVKPVFLAEEFVAETSYASMACDPNSRNELEIVNGQYWCDTHKQEGQGHKCSFKVDFNKGDMYKDYNGTWNGVDVPDGFNYWKYATEDNTDKAYLFNQDNTSCDFLWSGNTDDNVYAYTTVEKKDTGNWFNLGNLSKFFFGTGSIGGEGHSIGYMGARMLSI